MSHRTFFEELERRESYIVQCAKKAIPKHGPWAEIVNHKFNYREGFSIFGDVWTCELTELIEDSSRWAKNAGKEAANLSFILGPDKAGQEWYREVLKFAHFLEFGIVSSTFTQTNEIYENLQSASERFKSTREYSREELYQWAYEMRYRGEILSSIELNASSLGEKLKELNKRKEPPLPEGLPNYVASYAVIKEIAKKKQDKRQEARELY